MQSIGYGAAKRRAGSGEERHPTPAAREMLAADPPLRGGKRSRVLTLRRPFATSAQSRASAMGKNFDVIVIGGGHAGFEAAAAAARMGARTALLTHRFATIGAMSCNPAIGGLGKGHLVREIDALDGLMGRVADRGGIPCPGVHRPKGPAAPGARGPADPQLRARALQPPTREA